jgi:acyl-CoA dehydrogenase
MISFALDEDQQLILETVRQFAAEKVRPKLRELEKAGGVPEALRKQFHELGLGLIDLPESVGGTGASLSTAMLVHEELAFGDPGAAVALWAPGAAAYAIHFLGDEGQQQRLLGRFADPAGHARLGAVAWAERGGKLEGLSTTARKDGAGWVLDGKKAFVVNGGIADLTVVFAQLEGTSGWSGIGAFVVEAGNAGLRQGARHELVGLETVHAAELVLEGCRVPEANRLLGGASFGAGVGSMFLRQSLVNAARQVGLARASYELALEYTQERKAFGKPIAHFQSIAFTLAEMAMDVDAARWMVWRAAVELPKGHDVPVMQAISHANEAAWRVADNGVQLLGGAGFVQDYPVEKWMRDTKALALFSPPSEAAALGVAGKALGHALLSDGPGTVLQPFFT